MKFRGQKIPCIQLNKNANFNKNKMESKTDLNTVLESDKHCASPRKNRKLKAEV